MGDNFEKTSATTREFTLEFLGQITDNFSEERVIGRGGYGVVYKGVLENGEEIALKKLNRMPGLDDTQFRNEFNHLMRAQHPNITRLVGYCYDLGHQRIKHDGEYIFAHVEERVLCFEYLQGGSLDEHITDESCGLDWHTRFKIIKGICDGLDYLHNGCKDAIYHLDLKPSNILLDKDMVPKIGDFGLSRLFPSTKTYVTIKIIGTLGYMPPEYIERYEITSKHDVFSLGVIIIRIMAGDDGYSKCANMSSQEFLEHVHDNWGKRMQETMSSHTSDQVETCIKIALRCVEVDREKRPTIAEIVDELNKLVTAESSLTGQVTKNQKSNSEHRGRIVFSTTCRHPEQFDIFSCSFSPSSNDEELQLTDGVSYNYNGRSIPPDALKTLLKIPKLAEEDGTSDEDIDAGHVSGLIFVSERDDSREILYIALRFSIDSRVKVFSLADIFGTADFSGTRLEDSGCIIGGYNVESRTVNPSLIYVSTKEVVHEYCNPWTAVYKTNLLTGKTERLTPQGVSDLSPSVSPSGKLLAVASLESKSWNGEIENLKTNIYVMNMDSEEGLVRKLLIENGGWPSWGSDNIIFFHRATSSFIQRRNMVQTTWGVFRYNISTKETVRVTSEMLDAVTPAAISETKVAVATIRRPLVGSAPIIYRHIEIFDMNGLPPVHITQTMRPESNHYNPFVLDGGGRIGYHRCRSGSDLVQHGDHIPRNLHRLESPVKDVGLFRVSGVFPAISKDGSKLAFIDNEFKAVWIADSQGLRIMYETREPDSIFSPVWNQNPDKDILYVCISTSTYLHAQKSLEIYAISNASGDAVERLIQRLTYGGFNNAFPSSNPDGNKFVFQSTRDFFAEKGNSNQQQQQQQSFGGKTYLQPMRNTRDNQEHKNLYIMHNTDVHGSEEGFVTRLTKGSWTDTHCQWSPRGDWVAFSSTRDKPGKNSMSLGSFSVYLVKAYDPVVVIKLINGLDGYGGHVDYPVFSPYGRSIAVTMDLAAVSVDRNSSAVLVDWNSLPMSMHREQPYGDIFVVDIDLDDNKMKSKDVKWFRRITHSRYECSALAWTFAPKDPEAQWNIMMLLLAKMEARQAATSSSLGGLSYLSLSHNLQP